MTTTRRAFITTIRNGGLAFIYSDEAAGLLALGTSAVTRASHVEPYSGPDGSGWVADMGPSGGPVLLDRDARPFTLRAAALAAEVAWLREYRGV